MDAPLAPSFLQLMDISAAFIASTPLPCDLLPFSFPYLPFSPLPLSLKVLFNLVALFALVTNPAVSTESRAVKQKVSGA